MKKKEKDLIKVTEFEYVRTLDPSGSSTLTSKEDMANAMADTMPTASSSSNGLMPAGMFGRTFGTHSFLVLESEILQTNISLLLSISQVSGGASSLYFISIHRATGTTTKPTVSVKVLAGNDRMKIKLLNNDSTGLYKIFVERTEYTPTCTSLLFAPKAGERLSMTQAVESEVDQAEYVAFI